MPAEQEFLDYVARSIVEFPDEIRIERIVDDMGILLYLTVNRNDMGKVIGKEGNVAKALRTILRSMGMKHGARVNLKIREPEGGSNVHGGPLPATVGGVDEMKEAMDVIRD